MNPQKFLFQHAFIAYNWWRGLTWWRTKDQSRNPQKLQVKWWFFCIRFISYKSASWFFEWRPSLGTWQDLAAEAYFWTWCKLWLVIFVSPAVSRGDTKGSLLRHLSVCLSVRTSVCLSVCLSCLSCFSRHTSLFCNNSSSTNTIGMKHHIWIDLDEWKCHAQGL